MNKPISCISCKIDRFNKELQMKREELIVIEKEIDVLQCKLSRLERLKYEIKESSELMLSDVMEEEMIQNLKLDEEGKIDLDKIAPISESMKKKIVQLKNIIEKVEAKISKNIPIETIIDTAIEEGLNEVETKFIITKLMREGEIFKPKDGMIRRVE